VKLELTDPSETISQAIFATVSRPRVDGDGESALIGATARDRAQPDRQQYQDWQLSMYRRAMVTPRETRSCLQVVDIFPNEQNENGPSSALAT
jgi:hypothetical protein